jgi:hypothetical protein
MHRHTLEAPSFRILKQIRSERNPTPPKSQAVFTRASPILGSLTVPERGCFAGIAIGRRGAKGSLIGRALQAALADLPHDDVDRETAEPSSAVAAIAVTIPATPRLSARSRRAVAGIPTGWERYFTMVRTWSVPPLADKDSRPG